MLKKAAFSPAQPRRAKTRHSAGKAATPQLTLVSRFTRLWNEARTKLADFFSILLGPLTPAAAQRYRPHDRPLDGPRSFQTCPELQHFPPQC